MPSWGCKTNEQKAAQRAYHKRYHSLNKAHCNEQNCQERARLKIQVMSHYNSQGKLQCSWPGCEVSDVDVLTIDHVANDGAIKRHQGEKMGDPLYRKLKQKGFPPGYQTLCCNHQWKKELMRRRNALD